MEGWRHEIDAKTTRDKENENENMSIKNDTFAWKRGWGWDGAFETHFRRKKIPQSIRRGFLLALCSDAIAITFLYTGAELRARAL
jgi:hypothetical protein